MDEVTFVEAEVDDSVEIVEADVRGEQLGDDYRGEEDAD